MLVWLNEKGCFEWCISYVKKENYLVNHLKQNLSKLKYESIQQIQMVMLLQENKF